MSETLLFWLSGAFWVVCLVGVIRQGVQGAIKSGQTGCAPGTYSGVTTEKGSSKKWLVMTGVFEGDSWKKWGVLCLLLWGLVWLLSQWLGAPQWLNSQQGLLVEHSLRQGEKPLDSKIAIEDLLTSVQAKVKVEPNNASLLVRQAELAAALKQFSLSIESYNKLGQLRALTTAEKLAFAEVLVAEHGHFVPQAEALVHSVLQDDAKQPQALFYAGLAAAERNDDIALLRYWEPLIAMTPADQPEMKPLIQAVEAAKKRVGNRSN